MRHFSVSLRYLESFQNYMDTCKRNLNKSCSISRKSQFVYNKQTSSWKVLLHSFVFTKRTSEALRASENSSKNWVRILYIFHVWRYWCHHGYLKDHHCYGFKKFLDVLQYNRHIIGFSLGIFGYLRKSSIIFGNIWKMLENDGLAFGQLLENLSKVFGNLRKIVKKVVIGMFIL